MRPGNSERDLGIVSLFLLIEERKVYSITDI